MDVEEVGTDMKELPPSKPAPAAPIVVEEIDSNQVACCFSMGRFGWPRGVLHERLRRS